MPHETTLITTIAAAFVLASVLGFVMTKLRMPPLAGYLLAGVLIGPYTPGFVADMKLASQLAEIGVILLMFGVGLHFSVRDLMAVRRIAVPGALGQIAVATAIGATIAWMWGWTLGAGLVFGLSLSVASTVVLLRALEERNALHTPEGRIAVGWLIVEDLAMVLALVLLPALAPSSGGDAASSGGLDGDLLAALATTLGKVALFVALALLFGKRWAPWLLMQVTRANSRELFTLAVLASALGIAYGSAALFDVSFALGAFFAGVILSESHLSHRAGEDSLPLKDAFAVLFFVSVGMLFDPTIVMREPLAVLAVLLVILIGKSLAALLIVLAFRYPIRTALTVSASLAQIGEFSFILAGLGMTLGLLTEEARDLILAGALLSIALNPLAFAFIPALERLMGVHVPQSPGFGLPPMTGHAVVVGHGRVGGAVTPLLAREGLPYIVIERDRALVEPLIGRNVLAICGDATMPGVLEAASIQSARLLIVAQPDGFQARRILELARALNPRIDTVVRTHSESEVAHLSESGVGLVVMGELELARRMSEYALRSFGVPPARAALLATGQDERTLAQKAEGM
jgi:CPA2 family monovalent cation:H+ antiporter-2